MKKTFVFTGLLFLILTVSCNKESKIVRITKPIIAGEVSKTNFAFKEYTPAVQIMIGKDTGIYPVLYTDTHLPNLLVVKFEPDLDNVVTFNAAHTLKWGSKYYGYSKFSVVKVSGSSNLQLCPKPLHEGDSISNSLEWVSWFAITTNDTAYWKVSIYDSNIDPSHTVPYTGNLWTTKSYLATRVINSSDTTFGWFQLQSDEDSATVSIFRYGYQE